MGTYVRQELPMRAQQEVAVVLELIAAGLKDTEIAHRTGVPRRTVLDWRRGRLPHARVSTCNFAEHLPLPNPHYSYLLGLYLGDGCLSATQRAGLWRLRIFADAQYPGIVEECAEAMEAIFPRQRANRLTRRDSRCIEISMYSKHWVCLFPQHGVGRKHHRAIELTAWQRQIVEQTREQFLRGLIHSDGCRIIAHERQAGRVRDAPRYIFSNRSEDIKRLFCENCDALGVRWTRPSNREIAIYRLESVARMDQFVGPKT
jgi:hypothetical protein